MHTLIAALQEDSREVSDYGLGIQVSGKEREIAELNDPLENLTDNDVLFFILDNLSDDHPRPNKKIFDRIIPNIE